MKPNTQVVILGLKSSTDRILHYSLAGHLEACHILLKGVELDQQRRVSDEDLCFRRARTQKHGLPRGYALATVRIGWIHVRLTHICARLPSIYFPSSLESPRKTKREENEVYIHKYTTKFTQNREKTVTIEEIHLHQTADTGNSTDVTDTCILTLDVLSKAW